VPEIARAVTAHVPRDVPPGEVAGAIDLVRAAARAGVPVAIVTSAGPDWVSRSAGDGLGLLDLVDVVVTADDVVDGKPDPTGFRLACERLGVDPADAVAAEDSVAGVSAAVAAGVGHVVGVTTSRPAQELRDAGAHATYADLRPVADLLDR
jgi:sugar-phosphatase